MKNVTESSTNGKLCFEQPPLMHSKIVWEWELAV